MEVKGNVNNPSEEKDDGARKKELGQPGAGGGQLGQRKVKIELDYGKPTKKGEKDKGRKNGSPTW